MCIRDRRCSPPRSFSRGPWAGSPASWTRRGVSRRHLNANLSIVRPPASPDGWGMESMSLQPPLPCLPPPC
eukprot:636058-Alexandrium_andersonii.AAC.1